MAQIIKKQLMEGDSASLSKDSSSQSLRYFIQFDTAKLNSMSAISAAGFVIGQPHPTASALSLESVDASPANDAYTWFFDCQYSLAATYDNPDEDPENLRTKVRWGSWSQEVAIPLFNSAGDLIDPPPTRVIYWPQVTVTKYENSAFVTRLLQQGSVNSAQFTLLGVTVPAYCAMLVSYDINPAVTADDEEYFENTFTINLCFKQSEKDASVIGFKTEYVNSGFNIKDGSGGTKAIVNSANQQVDTPQLLSVDGLSVISNPADINYITHTPKEVVAFSSFGLPTRFQQR